MGTLGSSHRGNGRSCKTNWSGGAHFQGESSEEIESSQRSRRFLGCNTGHQTCVLEAADFPAKKCLLGTGDVEDGAASNCLIGQVPFLSVRSFLSYCISASKSGKSSSKFPPALVVFAPHYLTAKLLVRLRTSQFPSQHISVAPNAVADALN